MTTTNSYRLSKLGNKNPMYGKTPWNKGSKGLMVAWNKGLHKATNNNFINQTLKLKEENPNWKGGLPNCIDCDKTLSTRHSKTNRCLACAGVFRRGENAYQWKGGITMPDKLERAKFRNTMQKLIFERDDYTCQMCGIRGVDLQVDHIQSWADYMELRFSMDNCRTLCMKCHYQITFNKPMPKEIKTWGHNLKERMVA